jgi:hypothetical protein
MQRNPYSPPATTELEPASIEVVRRPIAAWTLLLLLVAMTLDMVVGMGAFFLAFVSRINEAHYPLQLAVAFAWRLAAVAVAVFTIVSIYRRGRWGRWLGLAAIMGLIVYCFLYHDYAQYSNNSKRMGALAGQFFIYPALLAWWGYAFGFSSKARRYFSRNTSAP